MADPVLDQADDQDEVRAEDVRDARLRYPSDAEIIVEEAARFRSLSPEARLRSIHGLLAAGELMMRLSPRSAFLREYTLEQEDRARQAVKEFLARHARPE